MKQLLIIDGQVFQSPAWHRGMGKYSLELVRSMRAAKAAKDLDVQLVLSDMQPSDKSMLKELKSALPDVRLVFLNLLPNEIGNATIADKNRVAIDTYLALQSTSNVAISFLVLSMMQGELCSAFPSAPSVQKLVVMYDLIPLMFHDIYLRNPITRTEYLSKVEELLRADQYLAISKTVANDLAIYLGIGPDRVSTIDGGPIQHSKDKALIAVAQPFILMPTGNDLRKNNRRGIMGFQEFNERHENKYSLVITSFFKEHEIADLSSLSPHVVFVGNVSGQELNYLYEASEALLFPPEYEGLGLPILEAAESGKSIACSNIAVFREMSETAFCYFDPQSVFEISSAIEDAVLRPKIDKQEYKAILKKYTWARTAAKALTKLGTTINGPASSWKPRIAVCGPDTSRANAIGKLMQDSHAELSRRAHADYYLSITETAAERRINFLPYVSSTRTIEPGISLTTTGYDLIVYHLGNSKDYSHVLFMALANPGVVVLHDDSLELAWSGMLEKLLIDNSRLEMERAINKMAGISGYFASILASQRHVITHDTSLAELVQGHTKKLKRSTQVSSIGMPIVSLAYPEARPAKTVFAKPIDEIIHDATDMTVAIERSKLRFVYYEQGKSQQNLLELMRLGVVPVLVGDADWSSLDQVAIVATTVDEGTRAAKEMIEEEYDALSAGVTNFIKAHNSQPAYIDFLLGLAGNGSNV